MGVSRKKTYRRREWLPALLFLIVVLYSSASLAQRDTAVTRGEGFITGRLFDSAQVKSCTEAVIAVLERDSILVVFTRSQKNGNFFIGHLSDGTYQILFTHPGYNEYSFVIALKNGVGRDLGNLTLPPRSDLLAAVTIRPGAVNAHLRGDTLEYNVSHLQMKPNATVEEMLRRLPGIRVDESGNITVNGQRIDRLMVDGEDIFKGATALVTTNFNADMIDKVQVLNKKTKEAEFSGIDDGKKTRTLNLTLKEDSKRGYFGKANAGADLQDHYSATGLLGSFKNKRQFTALAMDGNIGGTQASDNSGITNAAISIVASVADPLGASAGWGIPHNAGGVVHFADRWLKDDGHFTGSIVVSRLITDPGSNSSTIQYLPSELYSQTGRSFSHNTLDQKGLSAQYEGQVDSLGTLSLSLNAGQAKGENDFSSSDSSLLNDTLANSSLRRIDSRVQSSNFSSALMWQIREKKTAKRRFSVMSTFAIKSNSADGVLYAINSFYQPGGALNYRDSVDQRKLINNESIVFNNTLGLKESLSKAVAISATYGFSINRDRSQFYTYGRGAGSYDTYIDSLSNQYVNTIIMQSFGMSLYGNIKKLVYLARAGLNHYSNSQADLLKNTYLHYLYTNLNPGVNICYKVAPGTEIIFDYKGRTSQPNFSQLQPVQNNIDPLHIFIGNPGLQPSFSHSFSADYRKVGIKTVSIGLRYNFTDKAFGMKVSTDSLGRQITQSMNVNGNRDAALLIYWVNRIKKLDLDYTLSHALYYTHTVSYVGSVLDQSDWLRAMIDIGLNKYVNEKYSIQVQGLPVWSFYQSAVNPGQRMKYWTFNGNIAFALFSLKGFEINTTASYAWQEHVRSLPRQPSTLLWNGFIGHNFLNNRLNVRWQVNDILGENKGISRNINSNTVSECSYNVLGRYWLLTATYRFVHHSAVK